MFNIKSINYKHLIVDLPTVTVANLKANRTLGFKQFQVLFRNCNQVAASDLGKLLYIHFESEPANVDTANANTLRNIADGGCKHSATVKYR